MITAHSDQTPSRENQIEKNRFPSAEFVAKTILGISQRTNSTMQSVNCPDDNNYATFPLRDFLLYITNTIPRTFHLDTYTYDFHRPGRISGDSRSIVANLFHGLENTYEIRRGTTHISINSEHNISERADWKRFPLVLAWEEIGFFSFYSKWPILSDATIQTVIQIIMIQLENVLHTIEQSDKSGRDPLTSLSNRRQVTEGVSKLISTVRKKWIENNYITVAMLDLDRFKRINDENGHPKGDEVLVAVARALEVSTRLRDDIIGRWGGEEFIIVAEHQTIEQGREIMDRVLQAIRDTHILDHEGISIPLSCSIGMTSHRLDTIEDASQFFFDQTARADEALYIAKNSGRDRVEVALCNDRKFLS